MFLPQTGLRIGRVDDVKQGGLFLPTNHLDSAIWKLGREDAERVLMLGGQGGWIMANATDFGISDYPGVILDEVVLEVDTTSITKEYDSERPGLIRLSADRAEVLGLYYGRFSQAETAWFDIAAPGSGQDSYHNNQSVVFHRWRLVQRRDESRTLLVAIADGQAQLDCRENSPER